jgi:1-aminocyclopropane-1-carboxylate deaminase
MQLPEYSDHLLDLTPWKIEHYSLSIRLYKTGAGVVSGNKPFKLKYWLKGRKKNQAVLSFGGAYSNHLLALSAVGKQEGISTIGLIRGEEPANKSSWLREMESNGMELHYLSRTDYRQKQEEEFLEQIKVKFPGVLIVPEGGSGAKGFEGAKEMVEEKEPYELLVLPGGTGTTAAALASKVKDPFTKVKCFQVLKGKNLLWNEIARRLNLTQENLPNLWIEEDYHFGGYGKLAPEVEAFRRKFEQHTGIQLDNIYGAKAMAGLFELMKNNEISKGAKILYIHTGGLGPALD